MPGTYLWSDIVTVVKPYVSGIPTSTMDATVCDSLNGQIWRYGLWRWSILPLTAISLTDGSQDFAVANSDFYRPVTVRLTRTDITPNEDSEKDIIDYLPVTKNLYGGLYS